MIEKAKQLKADLESLISEFKEAYFKVRFSPKNIKIGEKLFVSDKLPDLFVIIKKYLSAIESDKILNGFMAILRQEVKDNDYDGALFGENLKKIKNSKTKSYNWVYYSLFKEMVSGASLYAPAYQKSLKAGSLAPLKKSLLENDFDGQVKELKDSAEEIRKLKVDILFKPKIHKRFLLDFHKSVIAWLNAYILSAEFMEDEAQIYKEPLTDKWKNIEIRFTDDKIVKLIIDNKEEDSDYEKLGFADNRRNLFKKAAYVKSWSTLIIFSVRGGVIKMSEFAGDQKRKDLFIKSRLELSKRLMAYFGLPDDPIEYSQDKQAYKIKIKLTPSIDFRDSFLDQKKKIFESTGKSFLGNY